MSVFDSAWAQLGAVGLLGVMFVFMALGRLVPRSSARELVEQANRNADRWQAAAAASDQRADEMVTLMGEVLAVMRTVEALVRGGRDVA